MIRIRIFGPREFIQSELGTEQCDCFLLSRDFLDVVSRSAHVDEFSSALTRCGAEKKEMKMLVRQVPKQIVGESGGEARVNVDFREEEQEECVSLSQCKKLWTSWGWESYGERREGNWNQEEMVQRRRTHELKTHQQRNGAPEQAP